MIEVSGIFQTPTPTNSPSLNCESTGNVSPATGQYLSCDLLVTADEPSYSDGIYHGLNTFSMDPVEDGDQPNVYDRINSSRLQVGKAAIHQTVQPNRTGSSDKTSVVLPTSNNASSKTSCGYKSVDSDV